MYGKNAHAQYQSVQVTTTDRGRLLLMLYEGCIKFLRQAKSGLDANDIPKFCRFLSKGQAIIAELMSTLDFEKGGQIAKDLDRLYDFMLFYLTEANLEKNSQKVEKVIELVETIYGAYKEIIEGELNQTYKDMLRLENQDSVVSSSSTQNAQGDNEVRRIQISL
jgi:flagellar secretion chaperone FliS